jgi:hypothetical protein
MLSVKEQLPCFFCANKKVGQQKVAQTIETITQDKLRSKNHVRLQNFLLQPQRKMNNFELQTAPLVSKHRQASTCLRERRNTMGQFTNTRATSTSGRKLFVVGMLLYSLISVAFLEVSSNNHGVLADSRTLSLYYSSNEFSLEQYSIWLTA